MHASGLIAVLDPRRKNPFEEPSGSAGTELTLDELTAMFTDLEMPETTAMLALIGQLGCDRPARARAREAAILRFDPLPGWLASLDKASVYRAVEMTDPLGDGEEIMLGVRLATKDEFTLLLYIDHNLGTVVKDAVGVPAPISAVVDQMDASKIDPDVRLRTFDLADARARLEEAVERGARTFPPIESDTWPGCRPLVEWAMRGLPTGGASYIRPEWSERKKKALARRFFASDFGAELDSADHRDLLGNLIWFGSDYGPGDPLRWSPVAVEMVLVDWIPRKIRADVRYLAKAPKLLRAFIRFCHAERHVRPDLTDDTLAAVDAFERTYMEIIRTPRPIGAAALLDAIGVLGPDSDLPPELWSPGEDDAYFAERKLGELSRAVGGQRALDELDDTPLPDEKLSWAGIADEVRPAVNAIAQILDDRCMQVLDIEYRTACRRLLARAAAGDPASIGRRSAKPMVSAAAICWLVGQANGLFSGGMLVKDLVAHFDGVAHVSSQRAHVFLQAAGIDADGLDGIVLCTPQLLVSACRRRIIALRDQYAAMLQT